VARFINILLRTRSWSNNEKNISAQQKKAEKKSRILGANEVKGRTKDPSEQKKKGQKKNRCLMDETFRPHERLRKRKDFFHIYKKGSRFKGRYLILVYLSNELHFSRMAVVASKKIGNAVVRNRVKRRIRALYRTYKHLLPGSFDLIFITRREIRDASWKDIYGECLKALESVQQIRDT
jgi:ribonuclease P protein component